MTYLRLILLVLAFCLFLLKGLGIGHPRVDIGWIGLACLTLGVWLNP